MIKNIINYITNLKMINKGDRIVVGVSGGADSICLLHVLKEIATEFDSTLYVVHINHGIRGEEARRDEKFVECLCKEWNLAYFSFSFDVPKTAKEEGVSEEEAGRNLRYQSFIEICREYECNKIAIAHNKNDNGETILFHLLRGTGIKGLSGIDGVRLIQEEGREITIIRPLLTTERIEIEAYLLEKSLSYQTDSSNQTNDYSRNRIRNQIFPLLTKEINQNALGNIINAASQLREIDDFLGKSVRKSYDRLVSRDEHGYRVEILEMKAEDIVIQKGILREILGQLVGHLKNIESKHINMILALYDKQVGKVLNLPYSIIVCRDYDHIRFYISKEQRTDKDGLYRVLELTTDSKMINVHEGLWAKLIKNTKNEPIPKNSCTKWFDYDRIENAVVIRTREEGDYIQINNTGGTKKLKDYFIDQKIPKEERSNRLLLADGKHIMWVIGDNRISEKYKIRETTKNILSMKLVKVEDETDDR